MLNEAELCSGCRPLPCGTKTPCDLPEFLVREHWEGSLTQEDGTPTRDTVAGCEARSEPIDPTSFRYRHPLTARDKEVIAELEGSKEAAAKTRLIKLREKFDDMQGKVWDTRKAIWVDPPHPDRVPVVNPTRQRELADAHEARRAQGMDQLSAGEYGDGVETDQSLRIQRWNASLRGKPVRHRPRKRK